MASPQTLSLQDRRVVAAWAADCAEHVLGVVEASAPDDQRPRSAIARARAFGRGERGAAEQIRDRFVAGRAAQGLTDPAAIAAARSAAQAAAVAHMGAHALGAAAYAARAVGLAQPERPAASEDETRWQLGRLTDEARAALRRLPPLGEDTSGPLGPGLLSRGALAVTIRRIQSDLHEGAVPPGPSDDPEARTR